MNETEKIIKAAPEKMQRMLRSVYAYNSSFSFSEKLLEKILFSMSVIDRKFFAQEEEYAYEDTALPIGRGQTISQPSTITRMLLLAKLKEEDEVLEIGAGSGWNASLIAFLVYPGNVKSIDRINSLVEKAQENVNKLRNFLKQKHPQDVIKLSNLNFITENIFSKGKLWKKQYDKIIITAGIAGKKTENKLEEIAENLLKRNGLLVCPYISGPLVIYKKEKDKPERKETREEYVFVPLLEGVEE